MKTYNVAMTEHIHHTWTVEATSRANALEVALEGCPDDSCMGESDEPEILEDDGSNKKMKFTVIGMCYCGCHDSFVEFVEAPDPDAAAKKALKERERPGVVAAVISGEHNSMMTCAPMELSE